MEKSKINYSKGALTEFVVELSELAGYEDPVRFLNEKLNEVKKFGDFEFECNFYLNIHYLCKENAHKFWSMEHRKSISNWLIKSKIVTDVFSTTWDFWGKSPYELDPEQFYLRAKGEFIREGVYQNEEVFVRDQLERLDLLINKYRTSVVTGSKVGITQNQFVRLKQYNDYFQSIASGSKKFKQPQDESIKPISGHKSILFSKPEIVENLYDVLKGYFQGSEVELLKALRGEKLNSTILFPHNQNKFVEVFKRLKYNGYLLSKPKEIKEWICSNFTYLYQRKAIKEERNFNPSTVHDILTKDKGEPTRKERICVVDWLPYKSQIYRQREADKEIF